MKGHRYFLDTNIFLRPIVKDNPQKVADCERLFEALKNGEVKAVTSHLVLAELVWTAQKSYQIQKEAMVRIIQGILAIKNLKIQDTFSSTLALQHYKTYPVKFIDALLATHSSILKNQVVLISYDRDFDKLGITRKEPGEILKEK